MKKLFSTLLAALLAVSLLPMTAFAEEYRDGEEGGIPMKVTVEGTKQYTVNVSASPENYGTVTGGGTYDEGASVTVTATPNDGYIFTGWMENGEKLENVGASYTFSATADRTLTAVFDLDAGASCLLYVARNSFLNISGVEVGRELEFTSGTMITVTAVPKHAGFRFTGWRMANYDPAKPDEIPTRVSTEATYSFNIDKNIYLSAGSEVVQYVAIGRSGEWEESLDVSSEHVNESECGYVFYTSEGLDDLKFHFPPADCFAAPEGKVFDCWLMNGVGYEAESVQTVIGSGANPAFADTYISFTAKWKNDDSETLKCVISVPALVEIPYGQEYTSVPWSVDTLELGVYRTVDVTFYDGTFLSREGGIIPYTLKDIAEAEDAHSYRYSIRRPEDHTIQIHIAAEDWDFAAPGMYNATMRFDIKGVS